MKLAVYNGSPRGKASNSQKLSNFFTENIDNTISVLKHNINRIENHDEILKDTADTYLFVFPLYADITPYCVKLFFVKMEESKEIYKNKSFYFFIHSGFPEAKQSKLLERYLKYLFTLIGAKCMGVCIMGNSEMIRKLASKSKRIKKKIVITKNLPKILQTVNLLTMKS